MSWPTLVLVTVLVSVICGNRLMDKNRLLLFPTVPDTADTTSDESNEQLSETLSKLKSDLNSEMVVQFMDPIPAAINTYNNNDFKSKLELKNRNCNNFNLMDLMNKESSYPAREEFNTGLVDVVPSFKDYQIYGNLKPFENVVTLPPSPPGGGISNRRILFNSMLASLPVANYKDFYTDLVMEWNHDVLKKRNGNSIGSPNGGATSRGCDCKVKNDLVDLGQQHFPRYLLNAVCHTGHDMGRNNDIAPKCWSGSMCRPLEYKVKVLTFRTISDPMQKDATLAWLPDDLRPIWKFKTVTVTAGCLCS